MSVWVQVNDLYERRVDTWIRDFSGATHVLDVYRQKRVDKRKVFTSNYTRLKGGAQQQLQQPTLPPAGASPFAALQSLPLQPPLPSQREASAGLTAPSLPLTVKSEDMNDDALMADAAAAASAPPSAAMAAPPPQMAATAAAVAASAAAKATPGATPPPG